MTREIGCQQASGMRMASVWQKSQPCATASVLLGTLCYGAAAMAQDTQPGLLATMEYGSQIIEILDDGTWRFEAGTAVLPPLDDKPKCFTISGGQATFCPTDTDWGRGVVMASDGGQEHVYDLGQGLNLSIYYDPAYGHEGDLEYWEDVRDTGLAGGLINWAAEALTGLDIENEQITIMDDTVYTEHATGSDDLERIFYAELLGKNDSLYIELTAVSYGIVGEPDELWARFDAIRKTLNDSITISGKPLTEIRASQEQAE
ncbi:hypothetical protein [Halovulum sp. GXIMD14793]